ncbi:hypothetical protein FA95DRAFT_1136282 [Auriscalpium vulgare]|uniref:Uncharacterized protein n=1 Tax=Auriscalpium vulgare TaxID=40419 RepID=A0ACB8R4D7_9AGAM|nr:hypothetical protein FA95DRAFT_1136282 [Auriscalpium vulgare]
MHRRERSIGRQSDAALSWRTVLVCPGPKNERRAGRELGGRRRAAVVSESSSGLRQRPATAARGPDSSSFARMTSTCQSSQGKNNASCEGLIILLLRSYPGFHGAYGKGDEKAQSIQGALVAAVREEMLCVSFGTHLLLHCADCLQNHASSIPDHAYCHPESPTTYTSPGTSFRLATRKTGLRGRALVDCKPARVPNHPSTSMLIYRRIIRVLCMVGARSHSSSSPHLSPPVSAVCAQRQ